MRSLLCSSCLHILHTARRDALHDLRIHAQDSHHPLAHGLDIDATFWRLISLGFGAKARRDHHVPTQR